MTLESFDLSRRERGPALRDRALFDSSPEEGSHVAHTERDPASEPDQDEEIENGLVVAAAPILTLGFWQDAHALVIPDCG